MAILFGSVDTPSHPIVSFSRHSQMYRYLHLVQIAYQSHSLNHDFQWFCWAIRV